MTTPPKMLTICCPQCHQTYIDWVIPSLNDTRPTKSKTTSPTSPLPHGTTTICSRCGHRSALSDHLHPER